ncbi:MAG: nucleotidyl transferase AbiEii/AbiGii toxin family protein [Bacteroidales bacterium]|nr:nucleotidyl transferase AbiEii/AbiGii toxin family protein [Bacteroidales bacterium]
MHTEILSNKQSELLSVVSNFSKDFYLVGGTAIALYLGHRMSIDFDLFTDKNVKRQSIKKRLEDLELKYTVLHEAYDQLHIIISGVKFTFFNFPFKIKHKQKLKDIVTMPSLLDLGAMKAFAFGGRAKWKDYVDMYFLLKNNIQLKEITNQAKNIFEDAFNIKLFHQQLSYFADIDYSEPVTFLSKNLPSDEEIKEFLTEKALTEF